VKAIVTVDTVHYGGHGIPDLVLTVPSVGAFSQQISLRRVDLPARRGKKKKEG
jgi:hypothetical protein